MSSSTINLIDKRSNLRSNPHHFWIVARALKKSVHRSLLEDSQRQSEKAAAEVGACIKPSTGDMDLRGSYAVLKCWYCHASARAPNPSLDDMGKVTKDCATIYQSEDP